MKFENELEGQLYFWNQLLPLVGGYTSIDQILVKNTDGVCNGNIVEAKLVIEDISATLFQAIKYCSQFRAQGIPVPANIELVSLNQGVCYVYHSIDYLEYIEQVYNGSASRNNEGFVANNPLEILEYEDNPLDAQRLIALMREDNYTKVHIDIYDIMGWHNTYYKRSPKATKGAFLGEESNGILTCVGEIRQPNILKDFIYPYKKENNNEFRLIMDKLNARFQKKDLGAFYTPSAYVKLTTDTLLQQAIDRVPKGNDYVIIDNCAGSGNLLRHCSEEILSHYIISTYEFYEYLCLREEFGTRVRHIIPPFKKVSMSGLVPEANALSEAYVHNPVITQYINNPNCTIILNINPPYAETSSVEHQKAGAGKTSSMWKDEWVVQEAKNGCYLDRLKGAQSNDMANVFIWSAFHHYLRQDTDSLIVYSPIKYWKNATWLNKKFLGGYIYNRKHFHTNTDVAISCILWSNENKDEKEITLSAYDIDKAGQLVDLKKDLNIKRVYTKFSETYYDKRKFEDDIVQEKPNKKKSYPVNPTAIWCSKNGLEALGQSIRINATYNKNIVGYLIAKSNIAESPALMTTLNRCSSYDGNGFYLRADNFVEKLPMFAAGWWYTYNDDWTLRGTIYRTGDGKDKFEKDVASGKLDNWLNKVLFYTCLERYNKCRSLNGTDKRLYQNELSLDDLNGHNTLASQHLVNWQPETSLEKELDYIWHKILIEIPATKNYNPDFTYSPFQIDEELNTFHKERKPGRKTESKIYDYPMLQSLLKDLRIKIKQYYHEEIEANLFKYEFLK